MPQLISGCIQGRSHQMGHTPRHSMCRCKDAGKLRSIHLRCGSCQLLQQTERRLHSVTCKDSSLLEGSRSDLCVLVEGITHGLGQIPTKNQRTPSICFSPSPRSPCVDLARRGAPRAFHRALPARKRLKSPEQGSRFSRSSRRSRASERHDTPCCQ